jgi:hypothetical protein
MRYEALSYGEVGESKNNYDKNKDNDNDDDSLALVSTMMVVARE